MTHYWLHLCLIYVDNIPRYLDALKLLPDELSVAKIYHDLSSSSTSAYHDSGSKKNIIAPVELPDTSYYET